MLIRSRLRRPLAALRRGFTLLEILVVLAIIGLLVGLAVKNVDGILGGAQEDIAATFVNDTLRASLQSYRIHTGDFPSTAEGLEALVTAPAGKTGWRGPYVDVKGNKLPLDPWKNPYGYRNPGTQNKTKYDLFSKGKDGIEGTEDDIGNW